MRRLLILLACALAGAVLASCGGSGGDDTTSAADAGTSTAAQAAQFPEPGGRTIQELQQGMPHGLVLAPSVSVLLPGPNRYGFAVFDTARKQINAAPVALYVSRTDGSGVRGPFLARSESLAVKPAFQSVTTANDPDAAKMVYVATLSFPRPAPGRAQRRARPVHRRRAAHERRRAARRRHGAEGQHADARLRRR